jgi:hypothetical protein
VIRRPSGTTLAEMTDEERAAALRDVRRWLRDGSIRGGQKRPRTMRETEIWLEGVERRSRARRISRRPGAGETGEPDGEQRQDGDGD